jgi:hypothetical protein
MATIRCLEDEIERQLKCKICDVGLCIIKGEIQLHDEGVEACIYIQQITTNKGMCIEFYSI